jgi:D-inositol-3-phosphate glycosyltransferase
MATSSKGYRAMRDGVGGKPSVFMVDSVGAHRGMHYYNFALVSALNEAGARTILVSTPETAAHSLCPDNVPARGGFEGIYGDRPAWWRGLWYTLALLRIGWWAWRERPDVAHFHFYQVPLLDYVLLRWLKMLGVKTITTVHDVLPFDLGTDFASARGTIYHRLYTVSSGLLFHSKHVRDCLARLDPRLLGKSALIPQGNYSYMSQQSLIATQDAKIKIGVEPSAAVILVFGTIKPNKRLDLVIEAMARVSKSHPGTKLVVAGKPQDQDVSRYIELADQVGVAPNVLWRLGHVTDAELVWYLSAADVVVFPYQWIYQSAALVMAMSFGKPVIATLVGSNAEIIRNDETGILVPLDDPGTWVQAMRMVLDDKAYALAIGKAAHEYVSVELSWEKIAASTLAFYCQD